jgi:alpha-beta hydrolase superfamily lysophospholipase
MLGKGLKKWRQLMAIIEKNSTATVTKRIYPNARHSLINELNCQDVYCDVVTWLDTQLDN